VEQRRSEVRKTILELIGGLPGERRVFFDQQTRTSRVGKASIEHQMVGAQSLLGGESLARYMNWDALRGIDLLESLAEVDSSPPRQQALLTEADAHYRYAREAFRALGAKAKLRIGLCRDGESTPIACPELAPPKAQNWAITSRAPDGLLISSV